MNNVFRHTNAIENRMLIKDITLDFYGDDLLKVGFSYHQNADESMLIIKVSEREKYGSFGIPISLN